MAGVGMEQEDWNGDGWGSNWELGIRGNQTAACNHLKTNYIIKQGKKKRLMNAMDGLLRERRFEGGGFLPGV